jgi:hypothetical protein
MSTAVSSQHVGSPVSETLAFREVRIYSHSMLFYWWPVWVVGYVLALVTRLWGEPIEGHGWDYVHHNGALGVVFTFTLLLVIMMTHFSVRGVASLSVVLTAIAGTLFLAYMDWWNVVLGWLGGLQIYMNLSFYLFFSTAMFLIWFVAVFILVRFDYYVFRPGQLVHVEVFGGGEQSFDTRGMSIMKMRDDLFRHWVLGLGSGDINVAATGARKAEFTIHNVLFMESKLNRIQTLIAMKPDDAPDKVFTAGEPG